MATLVPILAVAFGAGALDGFQQLGALHVLQKEGRLGSTRRFAGTSAGSIVAFIAALRVIALDVMMFVAEADTRNLIRVKLANLATDFGVDDASALFGFLASMFEAMCPGSSELTFELLHATTGRHLMVATTCLSDSRLEVMDHLSTPGVRILDAIRASCSVPILFTSPMLNGKRYCDGGILAYYPHMLLSDIANDRKLMVCVARQSRGLIEEHTSFVAFIAGIMRLACTHNQLKEVENENWALKLTASEGAFALSDIASRQKMLLKFNTGALQMRAYAAT
jgi:predicted acylesterase/phospholipase RssA